MEEILLNPNVAYLLIVGGTLMALLSLLSPGSGILEIAAIFALLLAGWGVYNLPVNTWALVLLLVGVFPFILAVRKSGKLVYLGLAIAALMVASAFLFRGEGWRPAVHPALALVVSTLTGVFTWVAVTKTLEASQARPGHDLQRLIGAVGEAKTDIHLEGSAQVAGELWTAQSEQPIPAGTLVRVVGRQGFTLTVEAAEK